MRTTRACAALAAILLLTMTLTACGSDSPATAAKSESGSDSKADEGNAYGGKSSTTTSGSSSDAAEGSSISIKNFAFSPPSLKGAVGTTVTITNDDSPTHTWTADDESGWDSGELAPGKSYEHTFDKAGTYSYHCNIHSSMKGTVVVS